MSRPAKRRRKDDRRAAAERWKRYQFFATVIRIVVEAADLIDRYFGGGGPGRLL